MSEWIRHRGSKAMPKCLEGKRFEVRLSDGVTCKMNSKMIQMPNMWKHDGWYKDIAKTNVMAYRILGDIDQPKTAIELQAEEVGIPEPVQEWPEDRMDVIGQNGNDGLHYDEQPDADEPIGKRVADAMFDEMMKRPPSEHLVDDLHSAASRIKWESVFGLRDIADAARNVGVEIKFESPTESNKYQRTIKGVAIDVYDVLAAFDVTCQARGHAIKKLLMAGKRGHKDEAQDLREAVQAIERSIELVGK